jgi:hypothetical protein
MNKPEHPDLIVPNLLSPIASTGLNTSTTTPSFNSAVLDRILNDAEVSLIGGKSFRGKDYTDTLSSITWAAAFRAHRPTVSKMPNLKDFCAADNIRSCSDCVCLKQQLPGGPHTGENTMPCHGLRQRQG